MNYACSSRITASELCESAEPINEYAVVSYIPDQLGDFITRLRQQLVPGCVAKSHVTILPPRPLANPAAAREQLRERVVSFEAFEIQIPELRIFEETAVIFAEINTGEQILRRMHDELNTGVLHHDEAYKYHPHITLAQGISPEKVLERYDLAVRLWNELSPKREIMIENLTFVQNTNVNRWIDLDDFELRAALLI